jgi:signal transduction histidine kinase
VISSSKVTRLVGVGVTVHDMRVHALLESAKRWCARGGAGLVDIVVALMLLTVALAALVTVPLDRSPGVAVASCVVMACAVAWRRRMPTMAVVAALIGLVGYVLATHDPNLASPPVALVLTFYTLGRFGALRHRVPRLVLVAGLGLAANWAVSALLGESPGDAVSSWLVAALAPLAVGLLLARRSALSQRLAAAVEQLRAEQDLNAAQATTEERNRVARDLHDVVAHCVSVMVVQAGAARLVAAQNPADADRALAVIGDCGRDAMADLRRIVGVLRRTDDPGFGRGGGIGDLGLLTERIQAAGLPTQLHVLGSTNLPPAVDVVAYRVVQEALTNVVKHAGAGAVARVDVRVDPEAVTVEVTNSSAATARPQFTPSGHGLLGMKERVTAYGGDLRVGPGPDGGYGVRAQIPFHPVNPPGASATVRSSRQAMRPSQWLSSGVASAMIVAFWLVVLEIEVATSSARRGPWLLNAAVVAAMALAAGWRRRSPLLFLAVVGGLAIALSGGLTSLDRSTITGLYTLAVPLFTVAAWGSRTQATAGLAWWVAGAGSAAVLHQAGAGGLAGALVMAVVVWAAGRVWRTQLLLNADLTETTARLAAERNQRARLAVATERTRIARDLHGPVAHGVVTMVVQAEAARKLLVRHPEAAEAAIRGIEETGRGALTQLRRILGVLRSGASTPGSTAIDTATPPVPRFGERATWTSEQVLT